MKFTRFPALFLAAVLQFVPICRTATTSPAFASTLAMISRWTAGTVAALGAFDAVSGASQVYFDGPATASGTVGVPFTYYITLGGTVGTDGGSIVAAAPLPAGLTNYTGTHLTSPASEWGVISGIPGAAMTNVLVNLAASNPHYQGNVPITGSLRLTIYPSSTPVVITSNPTNVIATNGQSVSFRTTATTTIGPLSYQWYKSNTNIWNHIQGATNSTYTFTASTNSATSSFPVNAGNYLVRIAGAAGMVLSTPASLTFAASGIPPSISIQPTNRTVTAGWPTTFEVAASGTAPLSYRWLRHGTNFSAIATNVTFSIPNVRTSDADTYSVVVSNFAGTNTSSEAQLTVTIPPAVVLAPAAASSNTFLLTFTPAVGLTNSVLTNGSVADSGWGILTNIPPPSSAASITLTNPIESTLKFYRISFWP
ncbi:MAG: hypothetical protein JWM16_5337 [Verrucomicrobiales bacterium]|nr:hypothetical protein [Verrucomicrobiales bacterium]